MRTLKLTLLALLFAFTSNAQIAPVSGQSSICGGNCGITYTDATSGGTWSVSNTSVATIGSSSGILCSVSAGSVILTYSVGSGFVTYAVTVNGLPAAITGPNVVCAGSSITLSSTTPGGSWSVSNTAVGSISPTSGAFTGIVSGVDNITYTPASGCFVTYQVTVYPLPVAITGPSSVCVGASITLSDATPYGVWISSNPSIATVGGASGVVTGASAGTATISYVGPTGCYAATPVTVYPTPAAITGTSIVCVGSSVAFSDPTSGGSWGVSNSSIATITSGGVYGYYLTGITTGVDIVSYTLGSGCFATYPVTVNPAVASVSPAFTFLCIGSTATLTDATPGGTWSGGTPAVTVGSTTGVITAVATGTVSVVYSTSPGCYATSWANVMTSAIPYNVTGGGSYCAGGTGVNIGLYASIPTWDYQLYYGSTPIGSPIAGTGAAISFGPQTAAGTYTVVSSQGSLCTTTMPGSATVAINPLPPLCTVTGGGSYCAGGAGVAVGLSCSQVGINYQIVPPGGTPGVPIAGNGSAITFGLQTAAGTYTVIATNATTGCSTTMTGSAVVTILPAPVAFTVTGGCGPTITVGLSASQIGVNYSLYNGITLVTSVAGTGSALTFGTYTTLGTYTVTGTNTVTSCVSAMTGSATVTTATSPTLYSVTGGGAYCAGGTGVTVGLSNSQSGVSYQLYNGSVAVGAPVAGATGSAINFGLVTAAGTYTVVANPGSCGVTMTGSATVSVNPVPSTSFSVSGGGSYCSGGAALGIGLYGSQTGVNYQLYLGSTTVGSLVGGTGGPISFGTFTATGTYTVTGTYTGSGCSTGMPGYAVIVTGSLPTVYTATGGGSFCSGGSGVSVGLSGSQTIATYQLYNGTSAVGAPHTGTGGAFTFGLQTAAGTYTIKASNGPSCVSNMSGSAVVSVLTSATTYTVTGGGSYCAGGSGVAVGLSGSQSGISYQLFNGSTAIGSAVAGTGSAISFGLQTATGTYTVTANPGTGCATIMSGSAVITSAAVPTVYTVTGGGSYCSGGSGVAVGLSNSQSGVSYQLYNGSTATGSAVAGTGSAISFGSQTAAGTYTVIANPGSPCSSNMSGSAVVVVNPTPAVYAVTGGGVYCVGGAGVTIGVSGSQTGVSYQLYKGGVATGSPVSGTGSAIAFGVFYTAGTYTVVANPGTLCPANMTGSATVTVITTAMTLPATMTVGGGGAYCAGGSGVAVTLPGSAVGIDYQLYIGGVATGSPLAGAGTAISFGLQTIAGTYTVIATNTSTGCSSNLPGSAVVTVYPTPAVYNVTGGGSYCPGGTGVVVGISGSSSGVNYQLYRGGVALAGTTHPGTGAAISFGYQTTAGTYTVVATNTSSFCTSTMSGSATVAIYPMSTYTVTGGGSYCSGGAGATIGLSSSDAGVSYQLHRSGSAVGSSVAGTGSAISFSPQTTAGIYTVVATNTTTGCTATMAGSATVSVTTLPTAYNVTGGGGYCSGGTGVTVGLSGSNTGITYQLYNGTYVVGSPVSGTGGALSFGLQTAVGVYLVVARSASTGCTNTMSGSATITVNPLPSAYTVTGGGLYCSGGSGVAIGLSGSQTGVHYQLHVGGTSTGTAISGTGSAISFGTFSTAGTYTAVATNTTTGCTSTMTGSVSITTGSVPVVSAITGATTVHNGYTITLADATGGGIWSSSSTTIITVNSASGVVTGISAGTATITYTVSNSCGSSHAVYTIHELGPVPPPQAAFTSGNTSICVGGTTTLTNSVAGGEWSTTDKNIASVDPEAGTVYGVSAGIAAITYTLDNASGVSRVFTPVVVNDVPDALSITPGNAITIAKDQAITLTATVNNGAAVKSYQWLLNNKPVADATTATFTGTGLTNNDHVTCQVYGECGGQPVSASVVVTINDESVTQAAAVTGSDIKVVPNPNKGTFAIKGTTGSATDEEITITVTDVLGQVVYSNKVTASNGVIDETVQLGNTVANGMYLVTVSSGAGYKVFHMVVGR